MPAFSFSALDRAGRSESGSISAESLAEARRLLRDRQMFIVDIEQQSTGAARPSVWELYQQRRARVPETELAVATRQLASLLNAGMSLVPALGALTEQSGKSLGRILSAVQERVRNGAALATAFADHPRVFSVLYVTMVRAGETAGAIEGVLDRLASMLEKRTEVLSKVRAALAYPIFMGALGTGVVAFLLSYVVPSISKLFLEMKRTLPWPTQVLITASDFVRSYLLLILLAAVAGTLLVRAWVATDNGRALWDRGILRLPLFGDLFRKVAVSRFARTLGTLLASGVPILDALDIVKDVSGNATFSRAIENVKEAVSRGERLGGSLKATGVFPPIVHHMIAVGEQGGNIEDGLTRVADSYDREVESAVTALTALLEPVLIVLVGGVVGFIVIAILLPIFDMNQAIR